MHRNTRFFALCAGLVVACGTESDPACSTAQCMQGMSPATNPAGTGAATAGTSSSVPTGAVAGTNAAPAGTGSMAPVQPAAGGSRSMTPMTMRDAGAPMTMDAGVPAMPQAGQPAMPAPGGNAGTMIAHPEPKKSAGCGMPAPMAGSAMIDISGTARQYILALPANYDPNMPYKLIFAWHGLGGTAMQIASTWYGLKSRSQNGAIFVAGQGLATMTNVGNGAGWPNTGGQDVAFVKALYAQLQGQLCFDENRVFSVGMSYGGIMSNTLGCQMGDVFRAIAPMSGSGPGFGGRATCVGQVAVWSSHGDNDTVVATSAGDASRDFWVKANHCTMENVAVDPSPCVEYKGCDADSPVTFCKFMGGHMVPSFASAAIWKFFSQF